MAVFTIAALAVAAIGAGVSYQQQKEQTKAREIELEQQAEQEEINAKGKELDRRRKLNAALASNIVGQQVSGISGEGTPESIALSNAKMASMSEGAEALSQRLKQGMRAQQIENVRSAGRLAGASTLLKAAGSAYGSGVGQ